MYTVYKHMYNMKPIGHETCRSLVMIIALITGFKCVKGLKKEKQSSKVTY